MSILPRALVVACAAVCISAPAALAQSLTKYGPDLQVAGQAQGKTATTSVALNLSLHPSYRTTKPGVVVTMRNCSGGSLKLLSGAGHVGSGQSVHASAGKIVWTVGTVPGRPANPRLGLKLVAPKGKRTLCVSTSMYDSYTRKTIRLHTAIPL